MMALQAKDVPAPVSSTPEPKFDLGRDSQCGLFLVRTPAEVAILRRLAALRNAPEPNLDEEDLESTILELKPLELPPAPLEDNENVLYCVDTGERIVVPEFCPDLLDVEELDKKLLGSLEVEYTSQSNQPFTTDDKIELSAQSGVKSLKYNIPSPSLPYTADVSDLLSFLKSKKVIDDFTIDDNIILLDIFHDSEDVRNPPKTSLINPKEDKNDELSLQSGVKSIQYNMPSSSLPRAADLSDLLNFLRSNKVIDDFVIHNITVSIETLNIHRQKSPSKLEIPESIPFSPSKPVTSGSLTETVALTYPKTQAVESQPSTSGSPKGHTDAGATKPSNAQVTDLTDSPQAIDQLELFYPHKVYQYMSYPGVTEKVFTKDYCITCDPRYRRDRKTWLLHAKNKHHAGNIIFLYF